MGREWEQWQILFSWAPKSLRMVTAAMKLKDALWKKSYDHPESKSEVTQSCLTLRPHGL